MSERDLTLDRRPRGARIYDAAGGAEAALRRPIADDAAYDQDEPRHDPNLANILTIILVSVVILGFVFGMVMLSSML